MARWVTKNLLIAAASLQAAFFAQVQGGTCEPLLHQPPASGLERQIGQAIFAASWLPAPDVSDGADGLGPLYSATSCRGCHGDTVDGITTPVSVAAEPFVQRVVRLGDQTTSAPDPRYGRQIQERAIAGHAREATVAVTWERVLLALGNGRALEARQPAVAVTGLAYGPLAPTTRLLLRRPPPLQGSGVIAAIPDDAIQAGADPDDRDGDGVSGRVVVVPDGDGGAQRVGRFGWKARLATLAQQSADAFSLDMGLSSPLAPGGAGDCTPHQRLCRGAPDGASSAKGGYEVDAREIELVAAYLGGLPPPAPNWPPLRVAQGERQLTALACTACHRPAFEALPAGARPYSDLLVHDMGEGLADAASDTEKATQREWRTAPLWGMAGRLDQIARGEIDGLLHDGRAQTIEAAIAWHGGEARSSRDRFFALSPQEQSALVDFLRGL